MTLARFQQVYNQAMTNASVVRVRIPPLLDATTYLSLIVMSLLAIRGLGTLQSQLILLGLSMVCGLFYRFIFRTGYFEKNPVIYFGSQLVVISLMLVLGTTSIDAVNFILLIIGIHAALVLTTKAAGMWIAVYYVAVSIAQFFRSGPNGYYAAAFYFAAYIVIGFFGHILQQAELAREHNQQLVEELQSTQKKLQDLAVVEERNRLARDLHDSVKQQVFAISMQLSAAKISLAEADKAYSSVVEAERLAQQAGAELTTLINALRPPALESKSLVEAIREYMDEWSHQSKILIEADIDSTITVNQQIEQALFRVLQESLANVARHSRADKVKVALKSESDAIVLTVEDNGVGFDARRVAKGIGLDSMQERLIVVNGKVDIESEKSKGTRVIAKVRMSS